jgi:hypothetical protein
MPSWALYGNERRRGPGPAGAAASAVMTFRSGPAAQAGASEMTFASVPIGDAAADRLVVVGLQATHTTGVPITLTIGGVSATSAVAVVDVGGSDSRVQLFYATVPTGTTADVVAASTFISVMQIAVYTLTGVSATPTATGTTAYNTINPGTMSVNATVPAGGFGIAVFGADRDVTTTFASATTDFNQHHAGSGNEIWALSTPTAGSQTPTSDAGEVCVYAAVMACWGP